jgi:hypothetical protein
MFTLLLFPKPTEKMITDFLLSWYLMPLQMWFPTK